MYMQLGVSAIQNLIANYHELLLQIPVCLKKKNFACRVRANLVVDMTFLRLI